MASAFYAQAPGGLSSQRQGLLLELRELLHIPPERHQATEDALRERTHLPPAAPQPEHKLRYVLAVSRPCSSTRLTAALRL